MRTSRFFLGPTEYMRTKKSARLSSVGLCEDSLKFWEQRGQPGCPQQGWAWPQEDKKNLWGPRGQRARLSSAWERLKFETEIQKHPPFVPKITTCAHFCSKNHNICTSKTKFVTMSHYEDRPQYVPPWCHSLVSLSNVTLKCHCLVSLYSVTLQWYPLVVGSGC